MVDIESILALFDFEKKTTIERCLEFMNTPNNDVCLE